MSELCRRQIIRQQQIMKKSALTVLIALLPLAAIAQTPSINEDGKKIEKEKMETKDYIIRKSKFPQNPKRSVRFSGKRTKRSVQKRKARNTQKAETKVL